MKNIIYISLLITFLGGCTKKYTDLNVDPNAYTTVAPEGLMSTAIKRTGEMIGGNGLNSGINVNMWQIANLIEPGARYGANDQGIWQASYVGILENLVQVNKLYGNDTGFVNRVQIANIWRAYVYSILVGYYGPIPVDQANNPDNLYSVQFENEDTVYTKILRILKDASSKIDVNRTKDKLTYDVLFPVGQYPNSLVNWKKFANTLRLRIALRCRINLKTLAEATIQEVMQDEANLINAETETVKIPFENVNNNENPYFRVFTKNPYTITPFPKLPDMLFTYLRSYRDPRLYYYFDSVKAVKDRFIVQDTLPSTADDSLRAVSYPIPYAGYPKITKYLAGWTALTAAGVVDPMAGNGVNAFSNMAAAIYTNPARPLVVLSYAEAQFLKAEAAQLALGGAQPASAYYNSGIDANFAFWGIPATVRDAYKQVDGVKWGTENNNAFENYTGIITTQVPAGDINKIYFQSYLNFFPDQPFDAWCLQRQTRVMIFSPHTNPGSAVLLFQDIPDRGVYPNTILTRNPVGYQSALTLLGAGGSNEEINNPYLRLHFEKPYTVPNWDAKPAHFTSKYMQKWYGNTIEELRAAGAAIGFTVTVRGTFKN